MDTRFTTDSSRVFDLCLHPDFMLLSNCLENSRRQPFQAPLPPVPPQVVGHGMATGAFPGPGVNQSGFAGGTTPILVDAMGNPLPRGLPPGAVLTAWNPPGISPPWPQDELLADGGDLPRSRCSERTPWGN